MGRAHRVVVLPDVGQDLLEGTSGRAADLGMPPLPPDEVTEPNFVLEPHRNAMSAKPGHGAICNPEEVRDACCHKEKGNNSCRR